MKIDFDNVRIETDNVNLISLDGTFYPGRNRFVDGHIIICEKNGHKRRCYNYDLPVHLLEDILLDLYSYFAGEGARNFALLADRYLINIDNVKQMHLKSNLRGIHLVEAEFKNGQIVEMYKGRNEEYAIGLIQKYERGEERYLNQAKVKE